MWTDRLDEVLEQQQIPYGVIREIALSGTSSCRGELFRKMKRVGYEEGGVEKRNGTGRGGVWNGQEGDGMTDAICDMMLITNAHVVKQQHPSTWQAHLHLYANNSVSCKRYTLF